jgi:hypothetical protein
MAWEAVWGAVFYYLMLGARRHLDGPGGARWSTRRALGLQAPLRALAVLLIGGIMLSPLTIWTFVVGPQWPFMVVLVVALVAIAVSALRVAQPPARRSDNALTWWLGAYAAAFAALVVGNIIHEGHLTLYIAVQALGLVGVATFATFPLWAQRRTAPDGADVARPDRDPALSMEKWRENGARCARRFRDAQLQRDRAGTHGPIYRPLPGKSGVFFVHLRATAVVRQTNTPR